VRVPFAFASKAHRASKSGIALTALTPWMSMSRMQIRPLSLTDETAAFDVP
jgi:hypothetical protein